MLNIGIPLERTNQDNCKPNSHGYKLIELCKNNNLFIVNGRVCDDKRIGKITGKGTSVVDYDIASLYILQNIIKFKVLDFCDGALFWPLANASRGILIRPIADYQPLTIDCSATNLAVIVSIRLCLL